MSQLDADEQKGGDAHATVGFSEDDREMMSETRPNFLRSHEVQRLAAALPALQKALVNYEALP